LRSTQVQSLVSGVIESGVEGDCAAGSGVVVLAGSGVVVMVRSLTPPPVTVDHDLQFMIDTYSRPSAHDHRDLEAGSSGRRRDP
jgi:uncharacterized protein (AIM24 family)